MNDKGRKPHILFPAALLLLAVLVLAGRESAAWFSLHRSISTPSAIAMPAVLDIRGKDHSEIGYISLNELSTAEGEGSAQFLFCVCGETQIQYVIELAYTTNVPFRYKILPASTTNTLPGNWVAYTAEETAAAYYYRADSPLTLRYLNKTVDAGGNQVAEQSGYYYGKVYAETDNVHPAAMPLLQVSEDIQSEPGLDQQFVDYYVLQVSWDEAQQSKEVDMIYLLAQVANEY